MSQTYDIAFIGAGPAGMAGATLAAQLGLTTIVLDEQTAPGGQIYRGAQAAERSGWAKKLGADYQHGAKLAAAFAASGAEYRPATQVWQVENDGVLYASDGERSQAIRWRKLVIAIGATERPVPIPGWTLPGVMTVGAAQILLKTGAMLPDEGVFVAGSGPLPLLYIAQVISAGGRVAGFLDTTNAKNRRAALAHVPGALLNASYLRKGWKYLGAIRNAGLPHVTGVEAVEALGEGRLSGVRYFANGSWTQLPAGGLLLHEGVVPNVHMTMALGCAHDWNKLGRYFHARRDSWGNTDIPNVMVAGDGGGIVGARASEIQGRLAAVAAAAELGKLPDGEKESRAAELNRELQSHVRIRPLLEALYQPRPALLAPDDAVTVCRCESVTAGRIREAVAIGGTGPNQVKSFTRCGMGPCQGRLCGLTVTETIAAARGISPEEVGFYRIRPPLKPLTLGELAGLAGQDAA